MQKDAINTASGKLQLSMAKVGSNPAKVKHIRNIYSDTLSLTKKGNLITSISSNGHITVSRQDVKHGKFVRRKRAEKGTFENTFGKYLLIGELSTKIGSTKKVQVIQAKPLEGFEAWKETQKSAQAIKSARA